ncbi:DNA-binding response regulator [Deinococcus piscis]|uniref:DNA-binding response regulator n=1 Tax=Deinococcus piscis TaxID=394230 RepID=A0ABQ3KBK6_9DEIO|nr:response regulator transcription factor [Deinococcus piscis]GHG10451.1 DNA-binding response regulator [Deinococcus piscis]
MIRVLLVDDQPLVRAGLRSLLAYEKDMAVVGEAASGLDCLHWLKENRADAVLLDIRMPGMSGIEVCRALAGHRTPGLILLTTFDDERDISAGLAAGARGFLLKDADAAEIAQAVRRVAARERYIQPLVSETLSAVISGMTPMTLEAHPAEALTPREAEVLALIARGMGNKRIALALGISENTVKVHVARILHKLGAADRLEAVKVARHKDWLRSH